MSVGQELDVFFTLDGDFESGEAARVTFYGTSAEAAFALLIQLTEPTTIAQLAATYLDEVGDE